jgi:uncharacterized protein (TIGR02996 family)
VVDERAFLRAIVEAPVDDAPRLVYADWLEEHGQGERAEFIRLQIQPVGPSPERKRRREYELLARHGFAWLGGVRRLTPPGGGYLAWDFGRGFVEKLTFAAYAAPSSLHPVLSAAFRLAPLRCLSARGYPDRDSDVMVVGVGLMHDAGAIALASCPGLEVLQTLELHDHAIDAEGFRALAESPRLTRLTRLDLRSAGHSHIYVPPRTRAFLEERFGAALILGSVEPPPPFEQTHFSRRTKRGRGHTVYWGASAGDGVPAPMPAVGRRGRGGEGG